MYKLPEQIANANNASIETREALSEVIDAALTTTATPARAARKAA